MGKQHSKRDMGQWVCPEVVKDVLERRNPLSVPCLVSKCTVFMEEERYAAQALLFPSFSGGISFLPLKTCLFLPISISPTLPRLFFLLLKACFARLGNEIGEVLSWGWAFFLLFYCQKRQKRERKSPKTLCHACFSFFGSVTERSRLIQSQRLPLLTNHDFGFTARLSSYLLLCPSLAFTYLPEEQGRKDLWREGKRRERERWVMSGERVDGQQERNPPLMPRGD